MNNKVSIRWQTRANLSTVKHYMEIAHNCTTCKIPVNMCTWCMCVNIPPLCINFPYSYYVQINMNMGSWWAVWIRCAALCANQHEHGQLMSSLNPLCCTMWKFSNMQQNMQISKNCTNVRVNPHKCVQLLQRGLLLFYVKKLSNLQYCVCTIFLCVKFP